MTSEAVAMLLPKGFVLNDAGIYDEVASYEVVPAEKITKFWGVYTTTFRRLVDPTASRLEYFWWHVWGSDRRHLSGPVLAKIFKDISDGPTFVPLRGPANRYDPEQQSTRLSKKTSQSVSNQPFGSDEGQPGSSADGAGMKKPTPSSSRPPPSHPILKKPRGPSTSGSRPTARFALPPDAADEGVKEDESSQSTASDMRPPPRPTAEKAEKKPAPAKKFVASTAASKRRPVLPRRQSSQSSETGYAPPAGKHAAGPRSNSQSSTGSSSQMEGSTVGLEARPAERQQMKQLRQPKTGAQAAAIQEEHVSRADTMITAPQTENWLGQAQIQLPPTTGQQIPPISQHPRPALEQPAAQTKPIITQKVQGFMPKNGQATASRPEPQAQRLTPPAGTVCPQIARSPVLQGRRVVQPLDFIPPDRPVTARQDSGSIPSSKPPGNLLPYELNKSFSASSRGPPPIAGFVADQRSPTFPPIRQSSMDAPERRSSVGGLQPPQAVSTVVGTSKTTAQGRFDSDAAAIPALPEPSGFADHAASGPKQKSSSLLNMQFTPTQPNPAPPVPFGRSKSQLKLVLEREKERGHHVSPRRLSSGGSKGEGDSNSKSLGDVVG